MIRKSKKRARKKNGGYAKVPGGQGAVRKISEQEAISIGFVKRALSMMTTKNTGGP